MSLCHFIWKGSHFLEMVVIFTQLASFHYAQWRKKRTQNVHLSAQIQFLEPDILKYLL